MDDPKLMAVLAMPQYAKAKDAFLAYKKYTEQEKFGRVRALLRILIEYGPEILALVLKILVLV